MEQWIRPLLRGNGSLFTADVIFWAKQGSLQVVAREIRAVGLGELLAQLAALKEKLAAEGLFAPERKKPLPFLPRRIGLITGRQSDAMHDVLKNTKERWPAADFEIREVAVQGVSAVGEVIAALKELDALGLDVIVIARGGGSMEDLLPFSNEALVRAASLATTPIVSAIGHEQDTPLLDFVADLRASTPTDAAKRIVPSVIEERKNLADFRARNLRAISNALDMNRLKLNEMRNRMTQWVTHLIDTELTSVKHLRSQIRALSPAATLERGYAIIQSETGQIIRDESQVVVGHEVHIRVSVGEFSATRIKNK